jgi:hypothetical protein
MSASRLSKIIILTLGVSVLALSPVMAEDQQIKTAPPEVAAETPSADQTKAKPKRSPNEFKFIGNGLFDSADTDGDAALSKEEFVAAHEKRFAEFDTDGDGKITREEALKKREEMHARMREKIKERRAKLEQERSERKEEKSEPAKSE